MIDRPTDEPFSASTSIEVRQTSNRGLGVFATRRIEPGDLIERTPVLVFPTNDLYSPRGTAQIASHVFVWDEEDVGIAMGYGSFYNHSFSPNARYEDGELDETPTKLFVAVRGIESGEEVTINYNGEATDDSPVGFDVLD